MKYPTRRYANPNEFKAYAIGKSVHDLARQLRRSERSITNWLSGNHKIPWYAPELLRLQQLENNLILQQMGITHRIRVTKSTTKPNNDNEKATIIDFNSPHVDRLRVKTG